MGPFVDRFVPKSNVIQDAMKIGTQATTSFFSASYEKAIAHVNSLNDYDSVLGYFRDSSIYYHGEQLEKFREATRNRLAGLLAAHQAGEQNK